MAERNKYKVPETLQNAIKLYHTQWKIPLLPVSMPQKVALHAWKFLQSRLPTTEELQADFPYDELPEGTGLAAVCGGVSRNLARIDFDDPSDFPKLEALLPRGAPIFKSQRPGGGYGVLVKSIEPIKIITQGSFPQYPKLEVRGEGGITVLPPTKGYEWIEFYPEIPVIDLAAWLTEHAGWEPNRHFIGNSNPDWLADLMRDTEEGGRSYAIVRAVNRLRWDGLGLDTIKTILVPVALQWPCHKEPMSEDQIVAQIERNYEAYAHQGNRQDDSSVQGFEMCEDDLSERASHEEDNSYLIDRLVMGADMANMVMSAYTKLGKTTLMLELAVSATRGELVWGQLKVPRPLKVLYVDEEGVRSQIRETVDKIEEVYSRAPRGMLKLLSGKEGTFSVINPASLQQLEDKIEQFQPDLIIIDGWQWFIGGAVLDFERQNRALAYWKKIRLRYHCGTIIIHHNKKTGEAGKRFADNLEAASGAQVLMDQARTAVTYEHIPDYPNHGWLRGRCGRSAWNPINMLVEYDPATQTHRMLDRTEAELTFNDETVKTIYGEKEATTQLVSLLNNLNRKGVRDIEIAAKLEIDRASITRWRGGAYLPSKKNYEALCQLAKDLDVLQKEVPSSIKNSTATQQTQQIALDQSDENENLATDLTETRTFGAKQEGARKKPQRSKL